MQQYWYTNWVQKHSLISSSHYIKTYWNIVMLKNVPILTCVVEHGSPANKLSCWNGLGYWGHVTRNSKYINQSDKSERSMKFKGVWFGPDLQLDRNWSEVQTKVNAQVGIWLSRRLSLKGRVEACATYVFPLILYRLAVLPLPKARRLALQQSLSRLLWGGARPMVRRQVCIQRTRNGGLGMPDLESHWLAERLAYLGRSLTGDAVWRRKASRTFPRLQSDPKAEGRRKPLGEALSVRECRKGPS